MHVHDLAFVRAGDKGDISNVAVMAKDQRSYEVLARHLVAERIAEHFADEVTGQIAVYPLPNLQAFQVVMQGALGGGATTTLRFDGTGKSMCAVLSRMTIPE
jgi:hypothetical protein